MARLAMTGCLLLVKIIPRPWLYSFAFGLGKFGYAIVTKQKKIARESLRIAFGSDKSDTEIEAIARDSFIYMAKSGIEVMVLLDKPEILKKRVVLVGKENLDNALNAGRGVILVSAHFGNFPLLMARLSLEGYKTNGIMRAMRDLRVEKIFKAKRDKVGVKTIYSVPREACVSETINALRNNELVFIPIDQNFGTAGIFVDFFGAKAATATGPVVLAQRSKAAIIPCFIIRQNDDTHKIIFEPALELIKGSDARETIQINIQRLTNIIESYIRKYPAEWGWVHRRWKSRPNT